MAKSLAQEFVKGLWDEIPPFRLVLGLCPTLAVTKAVENGIGMGVATSFVLVCSNVLVAALRNVIPSKVRIASYIIIIATFVTIAELLMQAYSYPMYKKLGIFTPLIVVNCIILGRAEAFASKNGILRSFLDGLGFSIGFTLALIALAAVRELLGTGALTFWEKPIQIFGPSFQPFSFMIEAPGAFVALGLMLCVMNLIGKKGVYNG
jgi:electron transport complex protein RnfE